MKKNFSLKYLAIITVLCVCTTGFGQSINPSVISSCGNYSSGSSGAVVWTLGEVMINTFTSGSNSLTQGFNQPSIFLTPVPVWNSSIPKAVIYPNPSCGNFSVVLDLKGYSGRMELNMRDALGHCLYYEDILPRSNKEIKLDLHNFEDGIYFMEIVRGEYMISDKVIIKKNH